MKQGVTDPFKKRVLNQVKKKDFYQQLLQEKKDLEATKKSLEEVVASNDELINYFWFARPGHFYSPLIGEADGSLKHLVSLDTLKQKLVSLPGIQINRTEQLLLFDEITKGYKAYEAYCKTENIRFRFDNDQFGPTDTCFLYLMLRHFRPKKVIEVGSGWTSSLMLDLNELYPEDRAELTFIEPYPERLYTALRGDDKKRCTIIEKRTQQVSAPTFKNLDSGDVLFIDDSHVSKCESDVNYLLFEILPQLKKGVIVHIHDIFYPFEYPYEWVVGEKRNWNEAYVVRGMLSGSQDFEILMWPSYLTALDRHKVEKALPKTSGIGSSLWLRKVSNP